MNYRKWLIEDLRDLERLRFACSQLRAELATCEAEIAAIGKPRDRADAVAMLLRLAGREHLVHTAVALSAPGCGAKPEVFVETSSVRFRPLSRTDAEAYLDDARTLDRAGAYDIATLGNRVVESFSGSYTNVMGLPAERVGPWLAAHGLLS